MPSTEVETLARLARDFASVVPAVDVEAEHDRFQPGLGPFKEERQVEFLLDALADDPLYDDVATGVPYPDSGKECDLVGQTDDGQLPVEVGLVRFRQDDGDEDPMRYTKVFGPFNEQHPTTLMTDARDLHESRFDPSCGLLAIYYQEADPVFQQGAVIAWNLLD
jgi:hypothetical protein